jgi:hypothetical protein
MRARSGPFRLGSLIRDRPLGGNTFQTSHKGRFPEVHPASPAQGLSRGSDVKSPSASHARRAPGAGSESRITPRCRRASLIRKSIGALVGRCASQASHFLTLRSVTPTRSANSTCDSPASTRAARTDRQTRGLAPNLAALIGLSCSWFLFRGLLPGLTSGFSCAYCGGVGWSSVLVHVVPQMRLNGTCIATTRTLT